MHVGAPVTGYTFDTLPQGYGNEIRNRVKNRTVFHATVPIPYTSSLRPLLP